MTMSETEDGETGGVEGGDEAGWVRPRRITQEDLEWRFGETTADDIQHVKSQLCSHARGFVLDNEIWFDQYAVMMGHRFAWNSFVSHHYPDDEKWVDVSDNALYFSFTGSGNFVIQYPIGNNLTKKHLETLYALCQKLELDPEYDILLRNEEYDSRTNNNDVTYVTPNEIYEHLVEGKHEDVFVGVYDNPNEKNGVSYRERMERKNTQSTSQNSNNDSDSGNSNESDRRNSPKRRTVNVADTWIEETDDDVYELYFATDDANEEFETMKWGEIVTERQAERFADELVGTHFRQDEIERLKESKYVTEQE